VSEPAGPGPAGLRPRSVGPAVRAPLTALGLAAALIAAWTVPAERLPAAPRVFVPVFLALSSAITMVGDAAVLDLIPGHDAADVAALASWRSGRGSGRARWYDTGSGRSTRPARRASCRVRGERPRVAQTK